jgi:hypothetical protein
MELYALIFLSLLIYSVRQISTERENVNNSSNDSGPFYNRRSFDDSYIVVK